MRKLVIAGGLAAATLAALPAAANAQVSCVNPQTNTATGAVVGAAGGAAAGALIDRHNRGTGALLGALGGAVLGGAVGHSQVRCPDGYYAYDRSSGQYYDNAGQPYYPNGAPPPGPGAYGPPAPGYGAPAPAYGAAPAGAYGANYDRYGYWRGAGQTIRERVDFLRSRIDANVRNGRIDRHAADNAYADLQDIQRQDYRLRQRDGGQLNGPDRAYLQDRLDRAFRNLHFDRQYNGGY
ncbi:MAG: glycine zipper 2TM domain-containing protein [Caulobacteraceae bacterium]|nr:glycine zipper 2TM domain-containing protein [Caulobacter sp.]